MRLTGMFLIILFCSALSHASGKQAIKNERFTLEPHLLHKAVLQESMPEYRGELSEAMQHGVHPSAGISAKVGQVFLTNNKQYTLDFDGDQLLFFVIDPSNDNQEIQALLKNIERMSYKHKSFSVFLVDGATRSLVNHAINIRNQPKEAIYYFKNGEVILLEPAEHLASVPRIETIKLRLLFPWRVKRYTLDVDAGPLEAKAEDPVVQAALKDLEKMSYVSLDPLSLPPPEFSLPTGIR